MEIFKKNKNTDRKLTKTKKYDVFFYKNLKQSFRYL